MTVAELIEELQKFPKDLPVIVDCSDIEKIYINEEHFFGDSANPECAVGRCVEII